MTYTDLTKNESRVEGTTTTLEDLKQTKRLKNCSVCSSDLASTIPMFMCVEVVRGTDKQLVLKGNIILIREKYKKHFCIHFSSQNHYCTTIFWNEENELSFLSLPLRLWVHHPVQSFKSIFSFITDCTSFDGFGIKSSAIVYLLFISMFLTSQSGSVDLISLCVEVYFDTPQFLTLSAKVITT